MTAGGDAFPARAAVEPGVTVATGSFRGIPIEMAVPQGLPLTVGQQRRYTGRVTPQDLRLPEAAVKITLTGWYDRFKLSMPVYVTRPELQGNPT